MFYLRQYKICAHSGDYNDAHRSPFWVPLTSLSGMSLRQSSQAGEGVRAGFEERGEEERKKIEQELIKRRSAARERDEAECPDMINMASTDVVGRHHERGVLHGVLLLHGQP